MHYAAKAIQIAIIEKSPSLQEIYSFTGQIFIRLIEQYLIKEGGFKNRISLYSSNVITKEDINGFETFTKHITQIELLECFCFSEKDHLIRCTLYEQITSILTLVTIELKPKYHLCNEQVLAGLGKPFSLPMGNRFTLEKSYFQE